MSNGQRQGLPPNEYNFHGKNYQPGHFLFFSSYDHPSSKHEIVYTYAQSRFFPPLPSDYQKSHCALRFFYCQSGSFLFHVFLVSKDNPRESKPLWTPPTDHVKQSCEWRRAVAPLKASILTKNGKSPEYAIRLSFAKITGSLGSIAIDDLTLSPGCFADASLWRMELIPERLTVSSCGVIGADRPKEEICPSSSESSDEISYTEVSINKLDSAFNMD
jgi:hypothetical protein